MKKIWILILLLTSCLLTGCSGDSAYDLAVENGFKGTIEDYLESLKADDNITIQSIFLSLVEEGHYNENEYQLFLSDYLSGYLSEQDDQDIIVNNSFTSTAMISCEFNSFTSNGSGVIYKQEGTATYIITNHHVINSQNKISTNIKVYLYGLEYEDYKFDATVIGYCEEVDLAVLKITLDTNKYPFYKPASIYTDRIYVGESIHVVGNALGMGFASTAGIISVDSEYVTTDTAEIRCMRIDAAINSGNSGGPVFNKYGELIAIVDAKIVDEAVEGIGYAIPISLASAVADNIIYNNKVNLLTFGFDLSISSSTLLYDNDSYMYYIKDSVVVTGLKMLPTSNENPYTAGLRNGDQIVSISINGEKYEIERSFDFYDLEYRLRTGATIIIEIYDGSNKTTSITYTL